MLSPIFTYLTQAGVSCTWTNDSQRIILEHFDAIFNSPSHLYYHALPFSPSSSWLHECYTAELLQVVKVVERLLVEWGVCSCTVPLNSSPWTLSYWNNTIAVGSTDGDILILDAITGSQMAVLRGHTEGVRSLAFSSDGTSLVSGSSDNTVKLWDMQTGGVVKTFHGHTSRVCSVSISADHTTIASGSGDMTIRLWNIEMGECCHIMEQQNTVSYTSFSPTDPQCLIFISDASVQCWDIGGQKFGPTYNGHGIAFSLDGTQLLLCGEDGVTIQNINSGIVSKLNMRGSCNNPCFSPDSRLAAVANWSKIYVWDITGSDPHCVGIFSDHIRGIRSLTFSSPSTLISTSEGSSVKFWQIGTLPINPVATDPKSIPLTSDSTKSIALKEKTRPIIPSDLPDGVKKTWGVLTGHCKGSFQIPTKDSHQSKAQPVDSKLIFAWCADNKINIWDTKKGELLQTMSVSGDSIQDLRVSGDGSKIVCLGGSSIQAWDIWTGEAVGKVGYQYSENETLRTYGSRVWVKGRWGFKYGWNFKSPYSPPTSLFSGPPDGLYINDTKLWDIGKSRMEDVVTGKVVFQLPEEFKNPVDAQWGGQYLIIHLRGGKVLVLNFSHVVLQ